MSLVLNVSGRSIYTQLSHFDKDAKRVVIDKRFEFHPAQLVIIDDEHWKALQKQPFIAECVDNEELETGNRAKKKAGKLTDAVEAADDNAKKEGAKEAEKAK